MSDTEQLAFRLIEEGKTIEKGVTHALEPPFVDAILGTLEYFGAGGDDYAMAAFDLKVAKYKIYDWLAMCCRGRLGEDSPLNAVIIPKLAKLYLAQKNVGGFAWWLCGHDLECEEPSHCEDCINSYNNRRNEE